MMSNLLTEARESADVVERLFLESARLKAVAMRLTECDIAAWLTIARGTSDYAAQYFGYVAMAKLGKPVTSLPTSLLTQHGACFDAAHVAAAAFSQSGRSPDIVAAVKALSDQGAETVAFVNDNDSPLAQAARHSFYLHAGPERSVAATKSFIAQLAYGALLCAHLGADVAFEAQVAKLPSLLLGARALDWTGAVQPLLNASRMMVISRGAGLPIACEAALKLKEVCGIQAEAFSGAEVMHGPLALVEPEYPVLIIAPRGPAQASLVELAAHMRSLGARTILAASDDIRSADVPLVSAEAPELDPVLAIQSFYPFVDALALARGMDPDVPRNLKKITMTV
jgi:glucosamine--fructose-6-phosphate aminotransferase (isomerizing)